MEKYEKGKDFAVALILIGVFIIVIGGLGFRSVVFQKTEYFFYGSADYTTIQNAAADTANNVAKACGAVCVLLGLLTSLSGKGLLNYYDTKIYEMEETNKRHNELMRVLTEKLNGKTENGNNEDQGANS